jgi:hypothetical protein
MLPESPNDPDSLDGDEVDDIYSAVFALEQEGLNFQQILEAFTPRWKHQIKQLQSKGYLGGGKNNTNGI